MTSWASKSSVTAQTRSLPASYLEQATPGLQSLLKANMLRQVNVWALKAAEHDTCNE